MKTLQESFFFSMNYIKHEIFFSSGICNMVYPITGLTEMLYIMRNGEDILHISVRRKDYGKCIKN